MGTLGKAIYTVGFWIRETGQALDRLGCRFQGNYYFQEQRTSLEFYPPTLTICGSSLMFLSDKSKRIRNFINREHCRNQCNLMLGETKCGSSI